MDKQDERTQLLGRAFRARILELREAITRLEELERRGDEPNAAKAFHEMQRIMDAMARDRWSTIEHLRRVVEQARIA